MLLSCSPKFIAILCEKDLNMEVIKQYCINWIPFPTEISLVRISTPVNKINRLGWKYLEGIRCKSSNTLNWLRPQFWLWRGKRKDCTVSTVAEITCRTTLQFNCNLIITKLPIFLLCRVDIRKGLNALKREIPGGDTFMHLGLQRVSNSRYAFSCYLKLKIKYFYGKERIKAQWISSNLKSLPFSDNLTIKMSFDLKANEQIHQENFGKHHITYPYENIG